MMDGKINKSPSDGGVCVPTLTPERGKKRQNGRGFKENGEEMFTLTGQDGHGVAIAVEPLGGVTEGKSPDYQRGYLDGLSRCLDTNGKNCVEMRADMEQEKEGQTADFIVRNGTKQGYAEADIGDSVNLAYPQSTLRRARVGKEISNTLTASDSMGVVVKLNDDLTVYAVWSEKHHCYVTIRKLTPRECFRLQGWTDDYFEKAQFVNSDSQLYKQAGNGVTVNVIQAIAERMNVEEDAGEEILK